MMAGYRPKSLDELNSIFDRTMEAEKAIKKGSSLLEKGEDSFSSFSAEIKEEKTDIPANEEKSADEISDSVSEFIAKFSSTSEKESVKAKPKMIVISPEAAKKEYEIEDESSEREAEAAVKETEKPSKDELFDEYMKIMSDEDDEPVREKKLSRKEKKRLRKKDKEENKLSQQEAPSKETAEENETPFAPSEETENESEVVFNEESEVEEIPFEQIAEEEKDDFDFPENYTPDWIKEETEAEEKAEEITAKKKGNGGKAVLKVVLSLVLIGAISLGALSTVFKTVVAANTGKLISDRYYVFTTYKNYTDLGLTEGTLVITEKKYAEDGEVFAYVDYAGRSFEFGRRIDSITKDDGEVLYVTEKDGGRTLVSRDECKGVVYLSYAGRGNIVSFLTDNFIVIVAAAVVISLIVVLLFVLVLRNKKDEENSVEAEEETLSEESEEDEFEDIFSTIE